MSAKTLVKVQALLIPQTDKGPTQLYLLLYMNNDANNYYFLNAIALLVTFERDVGVKHLGDKQQN